MRPPRPSPIEARFMFGLFNYETYNLYVDDEWIGQITVNSNDRSFGLCLAKCGEDPYKLMEIRSWSAWVKFLRSHQESLL